MLYDNGVGSCDHGIYSIMIMLAIFYLILYNQLYMFPVRIFYQVDKG